VQKTTGYKLVINVNGVINIT